MSIKYPLNTPVPFVPTKRDKQKKYRNPMIRREGQYEYRLIYTTKEPLGHGTGPFKSAVKAKAWYNNGGR